LDVEDEGVVKRPLRLEVAAYGAQKMEDGKKEVRFVKVCVSGYSYAALDNRGRVYTFGRE
jgi:hypothetical protein